VTRLSCPKKGLLSLCLSSSTAARHFGIRHRRQTLPFLLGEPLRWRLMLQVRTYVLACLHAFVQNPHFFHQARPNYVVVHNAADSCGPQSPALVNL
jgi:hypothetical protein